MAGTGEHGDSGNRGPPPPPGSPGRPTQADAAGNLVIADTGNDRIRVAAESTGTFYGQAMTAGDIYGVAGPAIPGTPVTGAGPPPPNWRCPAG